jgi:2-aminoadipate transaminase
MDWQRAAAPVEPVSLPTLSLPEGGISFASSRPADDLFPIEEFRRTCREVTDSPGITAVLQLGSPAGYGPLRQLLLSQSEAARQSDDILITSGCQQALDLLWRVLIQPGDTIAVEDPVYPGLRNVFAAAGARLAGVPMTPDGIDLESLEQALRRERPRAVVVSPNFQNPTGATMPAAARHTLIRLVRESGAVLIENDIYGALRYEGDAIPTLKELDPVGDTVQIGSFSKIAFPGLRVGWILAPRPLIARLTEAKQWCDLHSDQLSQAVLHRFAESGRLAAHRRHVIKAGAARLHAALKSCRRHLPQGSTWTQPRGGMSMWVRLPEPLDAGELLPRAERAGANYLPGKVFAVSRPQPGAFRLSFAGLPPARIEAGLAILGEVFTKELERVRAVRRLDSAPALV